jgi:uncharacterized protein YdeI (YjbR/CyaY-like superfamily)
MSPRYFKSPSQFRIWLERNHFSKKELWLGYHKRHTRKPSLTWPESVDQALCFGWIDGVRKRIDADRYVIRFSPRKRSSIWSAVNIKRAGELIALGLMQPAGHERFTTRDPKRANRYSFEQANKIEFPAKLRKQFKAEPEAWKFFQSMPPSYQKPATWWVISAKKEETQARRLARLIADSRAGKRIDALNISRKR